MGKPLLERPKAKLDLYQRNLQLGSNTKLHFCQETRKTPCRLTRVKRRLLKRANRACSKQPLRSDEEEYTILEVGRQFN